LNAINFLKLLSISLGWQVAFVSLVNPSAIAQEADTSPETNRDNSTDSGNNPLDLPEHIIQESPALQRWLKEVPDILEDIKHDPSFKTRFRLGFTTLIFFITLG